MTEPEYGPWIGWNGGECPVDGDAFIQLVFKNGEIILEDEPEELDWEHMMQDDLAHIIAYRVKKPPVVIEQNMYYDAETTFWSARNHKPNHYEAIRKAIITITDGKLAIYWADE